MQVEYLHGSATTTHWGRERASDLGSAAPLNVTFFELGNEEYNSDFVAQVEAAERLMSLTITQRGTG